MSFCYLSYNTMPRRARERDSELEIVTLCIMRLVYLLKVIDRLVASVFSAVAGPNVTRGRIWLSGRVRLGCDITEDKSTEVQSNTVMVQILECLGSRGHSPSR